MPNEPPVPLTASEWVTGTRRLSLGAKGMLIDALCEMVRSQPRGRVTSSRVGWARLCGTTVDHAADLLNELVSQQTICEVEADGNGDVTLTCPEIARQEAARESTRSRVARHRKRARNGPLGASGNADVTGAVSPPAPPSSRAPEPSAPPQDSPLPAGAALKSAKSARAIPPALDAVRAYWTEAALRGDPDAFFDHWQSSGWRDRNGPIRDWQARARTWSRNENRFGPAAPTRRPSAPGRQANAQFAVFEQADLPNADPMGSLTREKGS
jgi:hypothetical protein